MKSFSLPPLLLTPYRSVFEQSIDRVIITRPNGLLEIEYGVKRLAGKISGTRKTGYRKLDKRASHFALIASPDSFQRCFNVTRKVQRPGCYSERRYSSFLARDTNAIKSKKEAIDAYFTDRSFFRTIVVREQISERYEIRSREKETNKLGR